MRKNFNNQKQEMEAAGNLTPELDRGIVTRAHPFRYGGQEARGQNLTGPETDPQMSEE